MRAFAEAELGHDHYDSWRNAESCLRDGGTAFEHLYGMPIWRYYAEHPEINALFGEAMTNLTAIANAGALSVYQFAPFRRAIEVYTRLSLDYEGTSRPRVIGHYERHTRYWDADRNRYVGPWIGKSWHDRFVAELPSGAPFSI